MTSFTCKMNCKNCYHETQADGFAKDKLLYMLGFFFGESGWTKVTGEGGGMLDLYLLKHHWCIHIFR